MITLKFGGTSMGSARRIIDSAMIMKGRAEKDRISVVVSAVAGVSNKLQESIDKTTTGSSAYEFCSNLRTIHINICSDLEKELKGFVKNEVLEVLDPIFEEYERLLNAVVAFGECPLSVQCRIMGLGERLSSPIVEAVLKAMDQDVCLLDSRDYIFTTGNQAEGDPDFTRTMSALAEIRDGKVGRNARILLFPGFIQI